MKTTRWTLIPRSGGSAFTLVELLVVLAIISLLASIAFPSMGAIMRKARNDQARALAMTVASSCRGYYAEYSSYPLPQDGSATEVTPIRTDHPLTAALFGSDVAVNTKKINFLPDLRPVERGHGPGLLVQGEMTSIVDPWGEAYYVLMDIDNDNTIDNPNASAPSATKLYQRVLVYSAGADKEPSTWHDNVMSWQR